MRFQMKQRLFTLGDKFVIRDENGVERYFVNGALFRLGNQLRFEDTNGIELAVIQQKLWTLVPTYHIYRNGEIVASVSKAFFTFFHCRFTIDIPGPLDYEAEGNFLDHEYAVTRGGATVAMISKQWFALGDTYGVEIADHEDPVLLLAATVIIDMMCHNK